MTTDRCSSPMVARGTRAAVLVAYTDYWGTRRVLRHPRTARRPSRSSPPAPSTPPVATTAPRGNLGGSCQREGPRPLVQYLVTSSYVDDAREDPGTEGDSSIPVTRLPPRLRMPWICATRWCATGSPTHRDRPRCRPRPAKRGMQVRVCLGLRPPCCPLLRSAGIPARYVRLPAHRRSAPGETVRGVARLGRGVERRLGGAGPHERPHGGCRACSSRRAATMPTSRR